MTPYRELQRGDVGEADQELRIVPQRGRVERVDDALGAVAASGADHRPDLGIAQCSVESGQPGVVEAGEIAVPIQRAGRVADHEAPAFEECDAGVDPFRLDGPGWGYQHDDVTGGEDRWTYGHRASLASIRSRQHQANDHGTRAGSRHLCGSADSRPPPANPAPDNLDT